MSKLLDLTIAIPVYNEERNLPGCLEAIGKDLAKHVVVVDSGSTDATRAVAKRYGVEVVDFIWNGKFPKKRNWFLRNYELSTKWVLFLDADEYLTDDFVKDLRAALSKNDDVVGYWLNYSIYFLGRQLKGGYPLKKLALFKVGAGEYERIEEQQWSHLDMEVHEHPVLNGNVGVIKSKIDHRDFRCISHYIKKHDEYASWEARRYKALLADKDAVSAWTVKQKLKYKLLDTPLLGPVFFIGSFILMAGFRDGYRGFVFSSLKASYFTQVFCKLRELELSEKINNM